MTQEKGRCAKLEKELDELKKENRVWETKIADLDSDLAVSMCCCSSGNRVRETRIVAVSSFFAVVFVVVPCFFVVFSSFHRKTQREYITMAHNKLNETND